MKYCFDIDGIICTLEGTAYEKAKPKPEVIDAINRLYNEGHEILFYTARGFETGIDWANITLNQFKEWGLKWHDIYLNKPAADFYIDDKFVDIGSIVLRKVKIGNRWVGDGESCFIVAEIGINHNGDIEIAKRLIDVAIEVGCDAVKFQKRVPELAVPLSQWDKPKETPWGTMPYLTYKNRLEFNYEEYDQIDRYCRNKIPWFASCWDKESVDFIHQFNIPLFKIPSACLTDDELLEYVKGETVILSTGMSTMEEIDHAVDILGQDLILMHCTSSYPCKPEELNLRMIQTLKDRYNCPIGYSGHEVGISTTVAAVDLGATMVERHITLDRSMWGTDQAASVEPQGLKKLVNYIRTVEMAMGDGVKKVYPSELLVLEKLRG